MVLGILKGWSRASWPLHGLWDQQRVLLGSEEAYDDSNRNNEIMSTYNVPGFVLSSI